MEIVNWKKGLDEMLSCKLKHNSAVHTRKAIKKLIKEDSKKEKTDSDNG